jgi:hypothetical protein
MSIQSKFFGHENGGEMFSGTSDVELRRWVQADAARGPQTGAALESQMLRWRAAGAAEELTLRRRRKQISVCYWS